jgi:hypothetical protein
MALVADPRHLPGRHGLKFPAEAALNPAGDRDRA